MAVTPVGGATNASGTTVTTLSVTYSPTAGNTVVVYVVLGTTGQAVTVKDNLNNVVAQIVANSNFQYLLCQLVVPSGVTGYTVSFSTLSQVAILVEEYSGANFIVSVTSGGAAGQTSISVTAATPDPGDYLVGGFIALNTQTITNGNQRQSRLFNTSNDCRLLDNTSATAPTNVTLSSTFASANDGFVVAWLANRTFTAEAADGNIWGEYIVSPRVDVLQDFGTIGANEFGEQLVYASAGNLPSTGLTFAPLWGPFTMDDGWVGLAYDEEWWLEYCATPVTYTLQSGSLPSGLSLTTFSTAGGRISGTPTLAGTYSFTLRATNAFGFADQAFSILINTPTLSGGGGSWTFFA